MLKCALIKSKIRVIRFWKKKNFHNKFFFLVVTFKKNPLSGFFLDKLGFINNCNMKISFFIDTFKLGFWLNKGTILNKKVYKCLSKFLLSYL